MKFIDNPNRQSACSMLGQDKAVTHAGLMNRGIAALKRLDREVLAVMSGDGDLVVRAHQFTSEDVNATDWRVVG
jgi:hypothetical protein